MQNRVIFAASLSLFIVAALSAPAFAGPLGPKKPSQIVTLRCAANTVYCVIDADEGGTVLADGTETLTGFTVPAGKVFVLTSVNVRATGPVGASATLGLHRIGGLNIADIPITYGATYGAASIHQEFPTGIVLNTTAFTEGIEVYGASASKIEGKLNGYLTADK